MIFVGVRSLLPPPIWNRENEQGWQVVHCASAAAIFIGWYLVSTTPRWLPTITANRELGTSTISASDAARWNTPVSEPRRRCHADTASITTEPVTRDASITWTNPQTNTGLDSTAQMSVSCARPSCWLSEYPTGCCIQELAAMMKAADRVA